MKTGHNHSLTVKMSDDFGDFLKPSAFVEDDPMPGETNAAAASRVRKTARALCIIQLYEMTQDRLKIKEVGVEKFALGEMKKMREDDGIVKTMERIGEEIPTLLCEQDVVSDVSA